MTSLLAFIWGIKLVEAVGLQVINWTRAIEEFLALLLNTVKGVFKSPYRWKDIVKQINFVAWDSAPIILFCLCFAAIVTIIEASFHMKIVIKNDSLVPGFSTLLIIRELGAVVTALLLTSRVGAGIAAEVGSMKVTDQIDALKMLGINPIRFLVVPRFIACVLTGFFLTIIANVVCVFAAMIVSQLKLGYSSGSFLMAMRTFVDFQDLFFSGIKGLFFGAVIPIISCYNGFRCQAGAEGVGRATTQSVVASSIAIIILDFILSWVFSNFY